jgi:hypothetical protein
MRNGHIRLEEALGSGSLRAMGIHHMVLVLEHELRLCLMREGSLSECLTSRCRIRKLLRLSLQEPIHVLLDHLWVHLLVGHVHLDLLRLVRRDVQQIAALRSLAKRSLLDRLGWVVSLSATLIEVEVDCHLHGGDL